MQITRANPERVDHDVGNPSEKLSSRVTDFPNRHQAKTNAGLQGGDESNFSSKPTERRVKAEQNVEDTSRTGSKELKRYNLVIPKDLFDEVQRLADQRQTTVVDLFRRFIRLGLLAAYLEDRHDAALIIREGNVEREIILL